MLILTIRTDKPQAEIGLFDGSQKLAYETWPADRQLAETIHTKIATCAKDGPLRSVAGIVCFAGPGSFTGLRIGLSVGNALSWGLDIPIVATKGDDWIKSGLKKLQAGQTDSLAFPEYGAPAHITPPREH